MRTKEQKSVYDQKFIRDKCIKKTILLNREKDADIISWLSDQEENFNAVIKKLIREQIRL